MRLALVTLAALAVFGAACGDSDSGGSGNPTGPSGSSLAGNWKATRAEFVGVANTNQRVEVVARGTSITLSLVSGGTFTLTITEPGKSPEVTNGSWTSTSDVLKMTPAGMSWSWEFDMSLNGNTLTLGGATFEFDVNGDDHDEQAKLNMTLARQ
ncbi:MAG: hypothetical protein H6Q10_3425 [Acidobacteria bacterium]|nr:hypothetical protein [Acidobacteriota bacterium]